MVPLCTEVWLLCEAVADGNLIPYNTGLFYRRASLPVIHLPCLLPVRQPFFALHGHVLVVYAISVTTTICLFYLSTGISTNDTLLLPYLTCDDIRNLRMCGAERLLAGLFFAAALHCHDTGTRLALIITQFPRRSRGISPKTLLKDRGWRMASPPIMAGRHLLPSANVRIAVETVVSSCLTAGGERPTP